MPSSISSERVDRLRERLENDQPSMAKADLKILEQDWKALMGKAMQRCFALAGVSQKEAAGLMERDPAQVARWLAGTERPQLDAIFSVERFRQPLVQALAEQAGESVSVQTVVTLRRLA